jgi:uncharacterized cofD-like protein
LSPRTPRPARVVAVGGGHGTAVTLRAVRRFTPLVTAVVSVADDGGSSGRLRELLDVVALGDLRKCLLALADPSSVLARAFARRFAEGELAGHALGNLVLAGLVEAAGDLLGGIDEAARLLGACGRVLPATTEPVVLTAEADQGEISGQVAVAACRRIRRVSLVPADAQAPPEALHALRSADLVVLGPGSLYTSLLAAVAAPGMAEAINACRGLRVLVANLRPQVPETEGYDVADHVAALRTHGVDVDVVLCQSGPQMPLGRLDVAAVDRGLTGANALVHDPGRLAEGLVDLLA